MAVGLVAAVISVPAASAAGLPPLPPKLYGSFTATFDTTARYTAGMISDGADSLTVHATNVVFTLTGGSGYVLTGGTATVTDSGYYNYDFDGQACPCEVRETYDPEPHPSSGSSLQGQFTITQPDHGDSWNGAEANWVAVTVPTLVTSTGKGKETAGNSRVIGPVKQVSAYEFDEIPIKLVVHPGGDYSLDFTSSYSKPASTGTFTGGAVSDTYSGLLTSFPADAGDTTSEVTTPKFDPDTFTVTFGSGSAGTGGVTLQRRRGTHWVSVGTKRVRILRGRNSVSVRRVFGAGAVKRPGRYRLILRVTPRRGRTATRSVSFRVR